MPSMAEAEVSSSDRRSSTAAAMFLCAAPLIGLAWLKWPSAMAVLDTVRATGLFTPAADVIPAGELAPWLRPLARTASYLYTVRWALFYGLWISAAVRTFASPKAI